MYVRLGQTEDSRFLAENRSFKVILNVCFGENYGCLSGPEHDCLWRIRLKRRRITEKKGTAMSRILMQTMTPRQSVMNLSVIHVYLTPLAKRRKIIRDTRDKLGKSHGVDLRGQFCI